MYQPIMRGSTNQKCPLYRNAFTNPFGTASPFFCTKFLHRSIPCSRNLSGTESSGKPRQTLVLLLVAKKRKSTCVRRKCLIFSVVPTGLEPVTL